jgi:dihydropteroate synthase
MARVPSPIAVGPVELHFETPVLMGILNITPDSFSDGGRLDSVAAAVSHARALVAAGALVLDVGGESTRPGAAPVDAATELDRVRPVIEAIRREGLTAAISVDTSKAAVARAALEAGAHLVNDVTALRDPEMVSVVASSGAALIVMHMRGQPRTMQEGPIVYGDVVREVRDALGAAVTRAVAAGVACERILVDPGLGFGKTAAHNLTLTRRLGELAALGRPIVYGPSRKRFLGETTGRAVSEREAATAAACALAVAAGAHVLRVHDVAAVRDAVLVARAVRDAP